MAGTHALFASTPVVLACCLPRFYIPAVADARLFSGGGWPVLRWELVYAVESGIAIWGGT